MDQRGAAMPTPPATDPVVVAALDRLRQQYGALSADLVDAGLHSERPEAVRLPLGGIADLTLVLTFADAALAGAVGPDSLAAAGAQISLALDYAALLDTERRGRGAAEAAAERLTVLQALTASLAGALTAESIVTTVVSYGLEAFDAIAGALWVAVGDRLQLVGATDYPEAVLTRWRDMDIASAAPVPTAARERRLVLVHSLEQRDQEFPDLRSQPAVGVAFAAVPLTLAGELIGAFAASFAETDFISEPANLAFFAAVAGQCAVALHRVAVLDAEREARGLEAAAVQRLGRLRAVTARLSHPLSAATVAEVVLHEMIAELGTERGMLFLLSGDFTRLELVGALGVVGASNEVQSSYPADFSFPGGEAVLTRRPVLLRSTTERNRRFPALLGLPPFEEQALACVPLLVDGQAIGLLAVTFPSVRDFQDEDTFFLQALADQTAQALDRTRLREDQQRSRHQLALLAETGRLFAASLDLDATLEQVCRLLVPAVADAAVARVLEPEGRIRVVAVSLPDERRRDDVAGWVDDNAEDAAAHLRKIIDTGETLLMVVSAGDEYLPGIGQLRELGLSSVALMPLRARGRSLGLITAATATDRAPLTPDDVPFLSELAARVALAVDNARLFQHQTEIAHTLQRSLLPAELPSIEGAEVAVTYLPGTEGTTVGGDFYDVIPLPSGRFGLVIGDVMGRGVRAAAAMGQLRAAIRAYALEGHPPADLLARLDRLVSSLEEGLLVTCVYAEWDPGRCLIRLASAGHPPPLVRMPGEAAVFLELDPGMPLGVGNIDCVDLELELPSGAMLLAYTDGLVESPDLAIGDGMESLRLAVSDAGPSAAAVCRSAVDSLRALQQPVRDPAGELSSSRRRHDDDIALLALMVTGAEALAAAPALPASAAELELPAEPASAARARHFVDEVFLRWGIAAVGDQLDTAVLLVSELVTNAVRHAGTALRLRVLRPAPGRVRIEVIDHAPHGALDSRLSGEAAEGGRGLYLVETLADAWGSAALGGTPGGKTIWFELDGVA